MEISTAYNPKEAEDKIYKLWDESGFFNPDKLPKRHKKTYTIVIPPPNVTGSLHMGHALQHTIHDMIIRQKRMQGYKTLWLPGTDHAGIATQRVVEKELKKEGLTRFDLGKEEFIKRVWQWKEAYGNMILGQLKKLGSSCDWSRTRFTMDKDYSDAVITVFNHYYKKGLIYKGKRVVNWCPGCQTSLSDLEIEYEERKGNLWHIKYPIKDSDNFIIVATTRPETMLGDTAVAVNPKDKRYKNLVGKKIILPLVNKEIPIIADRLIDMEFGTGAVKVTPAHDLADAEIGMRHNLEIIQVINERGKIAEAAPQKYQGLSIFEARKTVIEDLQSLGLLEKTEEYTHPVPKCYRCNSTIELIPSEQWFLKMGELAKLAKKSVKSGKTNFMPKRWEKIYFDWLNNIKDWCISRQIWWGHQIPVFHKKQEEFSNSNLQFSNNSKLKTYVGSNPPKDYIQAPDVLDTWFSSALWPFAVFGWPKKTKDLKSFYPTDTLCTARDIINLWVARMIFSGMEFMKETPFKTVLIHPTVLTKDGKRMSKSLGTGIDPILLIEKYGADATRFGIAYQLMGGQDLKFSEENIQMGKKFCNKIWNASRFVTGQISDPSITLAKKGAPKPETLADKKILKKLSETTKTINKNFEKFEFGQAAHKIYDFFWHDFCDTYIEESKKESQKKSKKILFYVLLESLKLLHPFIPFVTEEIYQNLPLKNKEKLLMIESWPKF